MDTNRTHGLRPLLALPLLTVALLTLCCNDRVEIGFDDSGKDVQQYNRNGNSEYTRKYCGYFREYCAG